MKCSPGFNDPGKRRTFLKTVKIEEARGTRLQSVSGARGPGVDRSPDAVPLPTVTLPNRV